jgi:hypothetical protein
MGEPPEPVAEPPPEPVAEPPPEPVDDFPPEPLPELLPEPELVDSEPGEPVHAATPKRATKTTGRERLGFIIAGCLSDPPSSARCDRWILSDRIQSARSRIVIPGRRWDQKKRAPDVILPGLAWAQGRRA